MSLTNELFTKYGAITELELFKKKTDSALLQYKEMPSTFKTALVKMTAEKCKELCELSFLEYVPGYENRVIERVVTTEACDRDGDIIRAKGVNNDQYRKNPVVLFAHDKSSTPIGNSIKEWLDKTINGWKSWDLYLDNNVDTSGKSDLVFRLIKSGAMPGASIGFLPMKAKYDHTPEERKKIGLGKYGVEYLEISKLEHSACSVPANQDALATHLKSLDRKMMLDTISKSDTATLEKLFKQEIVDVFDSVLFKTQKTTILPDFDVDKIVKDEIVTEEDEEHKEVKSEQVIINLSLGEAFKEISKVYEKIETLKKSVEELTSTMTEKCDTLITRIDKSVSAIEHKQVKSLYDISEIENVLKL
jgi:phage head maturation protease